MLSGSHDDRMASLCFYKVYQSCSSNGWEIIRMRAGVVLMCWEIKVPVHYNRCLQGNIRDWHHYINMPGIFPSAFPHFLQVLKAFSKILKHFLSVACAANGMQLKGQGEGLENFIYHVCSVLWNLCNQNGFFGIQIIRRRATLCKVLLGYNALCGQKYIANCRFSCRKHWYSWLVAWDVRHLTV